uniref:Glycosylphosphatidylinositol anchor attachment 1 protein n=1 Tax=Cacopsylla melanoneura TaxID=428564 RepID=A0A8D8VZ26_9HEMI
MCDFLPVLIITIWNTMGLLTDPATGEGVFAHSLLRYSNKTSFLLYVLGVIWFALLAHDDITIGTHFSENALLPGLVKGDYSEDEIARGFLTELTNEMQNSSGQMPVPYLMARFHQLGLEGYIHNFTLHYPLGKPTDMTGRNVYAILRAPRTASMESLVLNIPYRPLQSIYPGTLPGLALAMSLMKFFRRQRHWAKDIILLISEHEQLGVQAWLEAYHGTQCGVPGVLHSGDLEARGGAVQAAITLEIQFPRIDFFDVKVSGLNGQLPNLDLINLVHKLCSKEGVRHTIYNSESKTLKNPMDLYLQRLTTLVSMVATQATGVPNGNHGLFHRFGIEALTLEGVRSKKNIGGVRFFQMGKVIEGVFRSMNNLLERFHQSYFFYLMPASDRFVSISYYMPVLALLVSTVLLKAYSAWMILHAKYAAVMLNEKYTDKDKQDKIAGDKGKQDNKEESLAEELDESSLENLNLVRVGLIFLLTHGIGYLLIACVPFMTHYLEGPTDKALFLGIAGVSLATVLCTIVYKMLFSVGIDWSFYFIFCRVELGLATMCIGVQNFSLGLIIAVIYVLPAHYVSSTQNRWYNKVLWLLFHPLCILYFIILASTMFYFPELGLEALLSRSFQVTRTTLVYSAVDALIYGSWVYSICAGVILPIWLMFWVGLVLCRV